MSPIEEPLLANSELDKLAERIRQEADYQAGRER
jgi:hypothetical protein